MVPATPSTHAGTVESRTMNSGYPSALPKVCRRASGPMLLPPIPRSTTWRKPASRTSWANETSDGACSPIWSVTFSHPNRFVISSGDGCHTVWSFRQIRPTTSRFCRSATASSTSGRYDPRPAPGWTCAPATSLALFSSMLASSFSNDSAKDFTPSASSLEVTLFTSIPALSRACIVS